MKKGILIVISGFSGAGKGTVLKELLTKHEDCYAVSISATTRDMREGEQEGVNYFYKTQETFEQIAVTMHMDIRHIFRLHGYALQEFAQRILS